MNITVINVRELFKYAIKIGFIIFIIYICINVYSLISQSRQNDIKENIKENITKINKYSFLNCLDMSISLISYKKENASEQNFLTSSKILAMGSGIFDKSILENTDLVINEGELTIDDTEELINQIEELPDNVTTEEVTENNIKAKYTTTYKDVKINNQTDYNLTEDMLNPNIEITNKKDILIYHTHTCESYTASERV